MFRILIIASVVCWCVPVCAQFKNVLLDPAGAYEPAIAVSRNSTDNIVAAAAPGRVYTSTNGGLSWQKSTFSTTAFTVSGGLVLLADFKGNFYGLHESLVNGKRQVVIRESKDEGTTWTDGVRISSDSSKHATSPAAAIDRKGNLFVTWTELDQYRSDAADCQSRVMLSRSSNGKKWSKPMVISQGTGNCKGDTATIAGATPAVMGGGERAFVVWANREKIWFDRAFDGGSMWLSTDLPVADQPGGWNLEIPGTKNGYGLPTLVIDNTKKTQLSGAVYIVWADQLKGKHNADIWFTRTMNFGDTWTQAGRINNDTGERQQYAPAMTLDAATGNIYVVYYDRRDYDDNQTDVYLAYSTDAGSKFTNVKISETPFTADASVETGAYISISAHNGVIVPVWTRTDNGKSSVWTTIIKQSELENKAK